MDIKIDNIMLNNVDGAAKDIKVKLIDFGIAKFMESGKDYIIVPRQRGALFYRSPEQLLSRRVSPASDIWGLAFMMTEMVVDGKYLDKECCPSLSFKGEESIIKMVIYLIRTSILYSFFFC